MEMATTDTKQNDDPVFGEALQRRLAQLGATRPWFVYRKRLERSDVCTDHNRLLVSCKRHSLARCPITWCFTPAEMRRVEDKTVGLAVMALDAGGEGFPLTCKYLISNESYRFIYKWSKFLEGNGIVLDGEGRWTRDVDVELWAFRSRALPKQPKLDPKGKRVENEVEDDHLHPDGSLGLVLMHHEQRGEREGIGARQPGGEKKDAKQQCDKGDRDAAVVAARGEECAGVGTAATSSEAEMVASFGQPMSLAVIGMLRLRDAMLEEKRKLIEQGRTDVPQVAPHSGDGNDA